MWDLWWIGVRPACHGAGHGTALLGAVEDHVRDAGARVLVIETSATPALAATRRFYTRRGYVNCGMVPDFYGDGDGKVTFARTLSHQTPQGRGHSAVSDRDRPGQGACR